jgi:hypothetical protein
VGLILTHLFIKTLNKIGKNIPNNKYLTKRHYYKVVGAEFAYFFIVTSLFLFILSSLKNNIIISAIKEWFILIKDLRE